MKKFCSFILILLLLLGSCTQGGVGEETLDSADGETSGNTVGKDTETTTPVDGGFLEELNFDPGEGISLSTLEHTADITSFKSRAETASVNMTPVVCSDGQYTYVFRRFPEELTGADKVIEYVMSKDNEEINEIEVYENHDYSEPIEVITLDEMAGKSYTPHAISYNSEKEEFYIYFSEGGDPTFYTFSRQGEMLSRNVLSINKLDSRICLDGKLYMIKNSGYNGRASSMSVVDPATDEEVVLDESVMDFYTEDGKLYYIKNAQTADYRNVQQVCSYDPASGEISVVKEMQTEEHIVTVYYDSANDTVYFASTFELFAYKDGKTMPVINSYDANLTICEADSEHIYMGVGEHQISVYQLADEPDSIENHVEVLRVCTSMDITTFETQVSYATEIMAAAGIPVRFEYTYVADNMSDLSSNEAEYVNNMAKKFLAEDSDYDLFILGSTMSELFGSKYYEDISVYPVITDLYDKMIDGMTELCSIDGKLALAPVYLRLDNMVFYPLKADDLNSAPKTFEEFFAKYDELTDGLSEDSYYYTAASEMNFISPWLDELASNYLSKTISDETAESDLVRLFDGAVGLDEYEKIYLGTESAKKGAIFAYIYNTGNMTAGETHDQIPVPKLGDSYKYSVDGTFLAVNPKSSNKELAIKFMAYYLNSIINGDFSNVMQFVKEGEVEASEDVVSMTVNYNSSKYKTFAAQIADSIHKTSADGLFLFVRDLYPQLEDGTITSEEAASRTLRYLKMIRDE